MAEGDFLSGMDESQLAQYKALNAEFRPLFLGGKEDFNWDRYLNDPSYAALLQSQIGTDPSRQVAKQRALDQMREFFRGIKGGSLFKQSGGEIDVKSLFTPLKQNVTEYANQARQSGGADISRQYAGAQRRVSEGLAGTGLGRSGAAAGGFAAVEGQRQSAVDRLMARVSDYEMQAQMQIDSKIADKQFAEQLRERGMNSAEIESMTAFNRSLYQMQFGQLLQKSEDAQKDFWDTWGQLIPAGIEAAGKIAKA